MKKKIAYAVFTLTDSGKDYMVKGNFGSDKSKAEKWATDHENDMKEFHNEKLPEGYKHMVSRVYPHGLFVNKVTY